MASWAAYPIWLVENNLTIYLASGQFQDLTVFDQFANLPDRDGRQAMT